MIVYVAGYPKSGTTWFTRLLGDAIWCPTGGSMHREDSKEIATEGEDRQSEHIVRKGHFVLEDKFSVNPVTTPHKLHWRALTENNYRVVFVVRDPRDIAVSASYHWKTPLTSTLQNMVFGSNSFRFLGPWTEYIRKWLEKIDKFDGVIVSYEEMLEGPKTLSKLVDALEFKIEPQHLYDAYRRQSFKNRVEDIENSNGKKYNLGKEFNLRFMRKGIAGDWKNHFSRQDAFEAEAHFGDLLRYFSYEIDPLWWKEV